VIAAQSASRKSVSRQSERKSFYILIRWLTAPRKWVFYGHPNHMANFNRYQFYAKCNFRSLMLFLAGCQLFWASSINKKICFLILDTYFSCKA